ncbi:MAG: hypothetical protein UR65_C0002G0001, partial [Candidatus Moranbacteria bacterium GW2011_GWE2_35_164]
GEIFNFLARSPYFEQGDSNYTLQIEMRQLKKSS